MKRRQPLPKKRTYWFSIKGKTNDGKFRHFSVYREGRTIEVSYSRNHGIYRYPCHPSCRDREDVEREIALVFNVKVERDE